MCADREMLKRAMLNLALNAVDAMPSGGVLSIAAKEEAAAWTLEIADTGPGLSPEAQQRAFEPFFTTKSNGTGLGLAIVGRIAEMHGGCVLAGNRPQGGAVFTLQISQNLSELSA
jgi:signal transduction histidine kinase